MEMNRFHLLCVVLGFLFQPSMRSCCCCGCLARLLPCCYIYLRFLPPGAGWDLSHLSKSRGIQHCRVTEVEGEGGRAPGDRA